MRLVNESRFTSVKEYLKNSNMYTIENFLKSNNLMNKVEKRGMHSLLIECPFHDDKNPSFSLNTYEDIFRCFSCGAQGRFLNFIHYYYLNQGEKVTIYDIAERLLKKDAIMRESLGFKSIYKVTAPKPDEIDLSEFKRPPGFKFNQMNVPISYKIIAKRLKNASIDDKINFINKMQHGESAEEIII